MLPQNICLTKSIEGFSVHLESECIGYIDIYPAWGVDCKLLPSGFSPYADVYCTRHSVHTGLDAAVDAIVREWCASDRLPIPDYM